MDRRQITSLIAHHTDRVVQGGPFAGMRLAEEVSWGDGDIAPKLLGTYEQELHPFLSWSTGRQYGAIVDIGCAEGYYAVGAARLFPDSRVFAFDMDERALQALDANLRLNGLKEKVEAGAACTPATLIMLAERHGSLLIVCDCEGGELSLFANTMNQGAIRNALRHSDLIIECHDFINPISTAACFAAFAPTHLIENIYASGRDPNSYPFLANLSDIARWIAVCENRPCLMNWLVCRSRDPRAPRVTGSEDGSGTRKG